MSSKKGQPCASTGEDAADTRSLYVVKALSDRGQGLVAATNIPAGTRILDEAPLITVSRATNDKKKIGRSISNQLAALSEDQRQAYFALYNAYETDESKALGIARTNALPLGSNAAKGAVFLVASRINHACNNNAQNTWNANIQRLTIHATREIREGDEITIYYLHQYSNRSIRQVSLSNTFRFACCCCLCSLPEEQRDISDRQLDEIQTLDDRIRDNDRIMSSPLRVLHEIRKLLGLLKEEGITGTSEARAYYDAFQVAVMHSDLARAKEFARRASSIRALVEGHDSPQVQDLIKLAADPSKHATYGLSKKWTTASDTKPQSFDAENFDCWLWKTGPGEPVQLADLRIETAFPAFDCLLGENDIDLEYLDTEDGFYYRPCKHWCFLAEIVDIESFLRLRLTVKDRAGTAIPIMFHTDSRGRELPASQLRPGYTVAVLYAEQHGFLDLSVGLRHENPRSLKIFPVALNALFELSDRVKRHATVDRSQSTCHTCGKRSDTLMKCARCSLFWYCSKTCQIVGWNEKGHKADKLLKDPDLQGLLRLKWDEFEEYHQFA